MLQHYPLKVLLIFLCLYGTCNAQSTNLENAPKNTVIADFPAAQMSITNGSTITNFSFDLYSEIAEWKAERLEERILLSYPTIQSIEIDAINNHVSVNIPNSEESGVINQILRHFKYNGYEEL